MSPLRAAFVASDNQGGGRVRSLWPAEALQERGWETWAGLLDEWQASVFPWGRYDVAVIHRPLDPATLGYINRARELGCVAVVDEDDDLTALPPSFKVRVAAESLKLHDESIAAADALIVSTDHLMDVYGPMARRAFKAVNFMPPQIGEYRYYRSHEDDTVRVGWTGIVGTHAHDLEWLAPAAQEALAGATLSHVGEIGAARILQVWGTPVEQWDYQFVADGYYRMMARADIGIVPLDPSLQLNRGKSWLKALEYAILGKPVVATRLPEQEAFIEHGVSGFLADTPAEFAQYVQQLIVDQTLRERMGAEAKERAMALTVDGPTTWELALSEAAEKVPA